MVKEVMNTALPVAMPDDWLQSGMQIMELFNVQHVVVYNCFKFKGAVSAYDLMQEALMKQEAFFAETGEPRRGYFWTY